jgi:hypothetical protein
MITKKDISKGAISNTHISRSAEIDPSKLKGDKIGSILIANRDGKYVARKVRGDAELLPSGEFKISKTAEAGEVTQDEVRKVGGLIGRDIKHGSTLVGERDGTPKEVNVGTGASAIPQRDSSGNLNADKLNSQDPTYYTNADNATAGTSTTSTVGTQTTATQNHPNTKVVATVSGTDGSGPNPASSATIAHNLGFIPSVSVVTVDGSTITPIETEVANGVNSTTITLTQTIGSLVGNPDLEVRLG